MARRARSPVAAEPSGGIPSGRAAAGSAIPAHSDARGPAPAGRGRRTTRRRTPRRRRSPPGRRCLRPKRREALLRPRTASQARWSASGGVPWRAPCATVALSRPSLVGSAGHHVGSRLAGGKCSGALWRGTGAERRSSCVSPSAVAGGTSTDRSGSDVVRAVGCEPRTGTGARASVTTSPSGGGDARRGRSNPSRRASWFGCSRCAAWPGSVLPPRSSSSCSRPSRSGGESAGGCARRRPRRAAGTATAPLRRSRQSTPEDPTPLATEGSTVVRVTAAFVEG
jgi:hypothetical protein